MFGLVLSLLYVAYCVIFTNVSVPVAVVSALGFLWTWHLVWTWVEGIVIGVIELVALIATFCGSAIGAGVALVVMPLCAFSAAIHQALFLGAVAIAMKAGITGPTPNWGFLGLAAMMYLIAIVTQRGTAAAASKAKS